MDDRTIMDNILSATKEASDLMMHGAAESFSEDVHNAFAGALENTLSMQNAIRAKMAAKGWCSNEQADVQNIAGVKQKFSAK